METIATDNQSNNPLKMYLAGLYMHMQDKPIINFTPLPFKHGSPGLKSH